MCDQIIPTAELSDIIVAAGFYNTENNLAIIVFLYGLRTFVVIPVRKSK